MKRHNRNKIIKYYWGDVDMTGTIGEMERLLQAHHTVIEKISDIVPRKFVQPILDIFGKEIDKVFKHEKT